MTPQQARIGIRQVSLALALSLSTGCAEFVRVPLAVPLVPVGGSRPAGPQGIHFGVDFGDGVWGQEQERAEMIGSVLGFSARDRVEVLAGSHGSTRTVTDKTGAEHTGELTAGVRGKIRLRDFLGDRASVAIHAAVLSSARESSDEQNERLSAVDVAVPVEYYPIDGVLADYRFGIFAAPRLTYQSFTDRHANETTTGTIVSAVAGLVGRWRYFALSGELNFSRTPTMTFADATFDSGFLLLPVMEVRAIIPIGG